MEYHFNRDALMKQCKEQYQAYPRDVSLQEAKLNAIADVQLDADAFTLKTMVYQLATEECEVHLFPACPLFGELVTGREQNSVTGGFPPQPGLGSWLMRRKPEFERAFREWRTPYCESGLLEGVMFTDAAHHYADSESVIQMGFDAIRAKILAREGGSPREQRYLHSIATACECMCRISDRFAEHAEIMAEKEQNEEFKHNFSMIARTARRVPRKPAETFYEALCVTWFVRELCNALEGFGFAVLGHMDRVLNPFLERDLRVGNTSRQEAKELIACFLSMTDARWNLEDLPGGTNASVIIGGCDSQGQVIFNDVTRMVLDVMCEQPLSNPKIQVRISKQHPAEYFQLVGKLAQKGSNVLSIFNDDVIIKAHQKQGKALEDCRLYLAGGCQETVVHNEVNCRAYVYVNLPQILMLQLVPEDFALVQTEGIPLIPLDSANSYQRFFTWFETNCAAFFQALASGFNGFESQWRSYNPCPLFSATMLSCIENALDVSQGGAMYNPSSFGLAGLGTLIDSLYAIKELVFEQKRFALHEFIHILRGNYAGQEILRREIVNRLPKFGQDDPQMATFADTVLASIGRCTQGMVNGHGGRYESSLFSFYSYVPLGNRTGATPDGRLAGQPLSRGVNPSESSRNIDAATLLFAQRNMDYQCAPGAAVVYMDLPITKNGHDNTLYESVIRYFLENGSPMLDFNIVNRQELLDAKADPMNHQNLIVRVCGYSAPFYSLSTEMQDEIINRVQR